MQSGRVPLALMFTRSGVDKLMHIEGSRAFMARGGLPAWAVLTMAVGLLELIGGLAIATGLHAPLGGARIGAFHLGGESPLLVTAR